MAVLRHSSLEFFWKAPGSKDLYGYMHLWRELGLKNRKNSTDIEKYHARKKPEGCYPALKGNGPWVSKWER